MNSVESLRVSQMESANVLQKQLKANRISKPNAAVLPVPQEI